MHLIEELERRVGREPSPDDQPVADDLVDWEGRLELALKVVDAPVPDLAPALRALALYVAMEMGAGVLEELSRRPAKANARAPILIRVRACGAELRDLVEVAELPPGEAFVARSARAELSACCLADGWEVAAREALALAEDVRRRAAMRPWLGRSLISICDVLIEPRPEDAPGRLERLDLILRFLDEARRLPLDEETAWIMHGLHLKALRKLDRLDEAEQVFVRVGDAPDWGWLFAIEAVRLASLRRDREGFVARRAKALELYPGEQAITVIRAPR